MAILPQGDDGSEWVIINLGNEVVLIQYPGLDIEKVHIRYDSSTHRSVYDAVKLIEEAPYLNDKQRFKCLFWMGYFYKALLRR
jgi:hypothetical protein